MAEGFRVPTRTARLSFEGFEGFEGAEVTISLDLSWDDFMYFEQFFDDPKKKVAPVELMRRFAESFLGTWNFVGQDGEPLPCNGDGMMQLPPWISMLILNKWKEAMEVAAGISGPLAGRSLNGKREEVPSPPASDGPASSTASADATDSP